MDVTFAIITKEVHNMDIASLSTSLSNIQTQNAVSTAVFSMALDDFQSQGTALTDMMAESASMERSVNPSVGGNIDMRV